MKIAKYPRAMVIVASTAEYETIKRLIDLGLKATEPQKVNASIPWPVQSFFSKTDREWITRWRGNPLKAKASRERGVSGGKPDDEQIAALVKDADKP
jgi:hypothetical protein